MSQCILAIFLLLTSGAVGLFTLSLIPFIGILVLAILFDDISLLIKLIIAILFGILIISVGFVDLHIFGYTKECWDVIWNYVIG